MATDSQNKRLICGDSAGYIAVYDIRTFCTALAVCLWLMQIF